MDDFDTEATPPPYTGAPNSASASHYGPNAASTAPPLPSYSAASADPPPSSTRLLHVNHSGLTQRITQLLGPDKTTVLYTVNPNCGSLFGNKPHVTVHGADTTGAVVGTVTFRSFSSRIDVVIHNNPIALTSQGIFTSAYEWNSLATTAEKSPTRLMWKNDKFLGVHMVCCDERENVYAKFDASAWAVRKAGKFEMGPLVSGVLMDEIVVTGLALLELRRRKRSAAAGSASGGASMSC